MSCSVGRTITSHTLTCEGADRHHSTASATSSGCRHCMLLTTAFAASSSPKARTLKKLVSTRPGEMPLTLSGRSLARACAGGSSYRKAADVGVRGGGGASVPVPHLWLGHAQINSCLTSCLIPSVSARTAYFVAAKNVPPAAASGMRWPDSPTVGTQANRKQKRSCDRHAADKG